MAAAAAPVSAAVLVLAVVLAVVPEVLARPLALPRSFDGERIRTLADVSHGLLNRERPCNARPKISGKCLCQAGLQSMLWEILMKD